MEISKISVKGFKSLKSVEWQPGKLNVVIGPNGSGKSNLLRLLELTSASAKGELSKYIQAAGGMDPLLWDGSADGIETTLQTTPIEGLVPQHPQTYEVRLARLGKSSDYRLDYEQLADYSGVESGDHPEPFKHLVRHRLNAKVFAEQQRELVAPEEEVPEHETLLSVAAGPYSGNRWIPPFQRYLSNWRIYHDVHVNRDAPIRQAAVSRNETQVASDGQNLISVLHTLYTTDREFERSVNSAMNAAFGSEFDKLVFPPAADQRVQLRVRWHSLQREQSAAELSDGTLRFLFLLTVLASPSPPPLIAIDEPETGLHPSMLPIVAEYAVDASERTQLILTTHSDQFLDAFTGIRPTTTVAKWANGETSLTSLSGDALEYWLQEYTLGALYRSGELEGME